MICKNRLGDIVKKDNSQDAMLKSIYGNVFGRFFLRMATMPVISKTAGFFLSTGLSRLIIKPFIKSNNIDMSEYRKCKYRSYNDFFTREIKPEKRPVDNNLSVLISPADGRASAYKINSDSVFKIKDSYYTVESILRSKSGAKHYKDGYCVIIRLCVDNYHRYSYVDNGTLGSVKFIKGVLHTVNPEALNHYNIYKENCRECSVLNTEHFGKITCVEVGALMVGKIKNLHNTGYKFIKGVLHTVNPEALNHYNIYKENCRECSVLNTEHFGKITCVEVGALMVGKIKNLHNTGYKFKKGEEKGMFEFGGSTVVLFIEKDKVVLDEDLLKNTMEGYETAVNMGEHIGKCL